MRLVLGTNKPVRSRTTSAQSAWWDFPGPQLFGSPLPPESQFSFLGSNSSCSYRIRQRKVQLLSSTGRGDLFVSCWAGRKCYEKSNRVLQSKSRPGFTDLPSEAFNTSQSFCWGAHSQVSVSVHGTSEHQSRPLGPNSSSEFHSTIPLFPVYMKNV